MEKKVQGNSNRRCSTRRITQVFSSNSLANKRCFLLAGGPSLTGFNYDLLKDEFTIGINKTFIAHASTINYSADMKFYNLVCSEGTKRDQKILHDSWLRYTGYKVFRCPIRSYPFTKDIYVVDRILEKVLSLDINQGIYLGENSGFGALMLAIAMGCKNIALLGYSLKVFKNITHWHDGYRNQEEPKQFQVRLDKFR